MSQQQYGINPIKSLLAAPFNSTTIEMVVPASDNTAIYVNDPVKTVSNSNTAGTELGVEYCTRAAPGDYIRGIVTSIKPLKNYENIVYRQPSTYRVVRVCQDPFLWCRAVVNAAMLPTDINSFINIDSSGGVVSTGNSNIFLDYATISSTSGQFKITKIIQVVTAPTAYTIVECIIQKHELISSTAAPPSASYWSRIGGVVIPSNTGDNVSFGSGGLLDSHVTTAIPLGSSGATGLTTTAQTIVGAINEAAGYWSFGGQGGALTPFVGGKNIDLETGGLLDNHVSTVITLGASGATSLTTTAKSLVGAINEVNAGIAGAGYWTRASARLTPTTAGDAINLGSGGLTDSRKIGATLGVTYLTDSSNLTLGTANQTIFGAINEIETGLASKFNKSGGTITGATTIEGDTVISDALAAACTNFTGWGTHSCAFSTDHGTLTGINSVLMCGSAISVTGNYSLGVGYGVAVSNNGCVCLADQTIGTLASTANNQFSASFANGYRLLDGIVTWDVGLSDSITTITLFDTDEAFTANSDAHLATQKATKTYITNYVAANATGLQPKAQCVTVATANITLSGEQTINGVLTSSSRVLAIGQTDQTKNGIWISNSSNWTRASDANTGALLWKSYINISAGTDIGSSYVNTNATTINLDVDNITYILFQTSTIYHNSTLGIQGGATGDYQHLTTTQVGLLPTANQRDALNGAVAALSSTNVVMDTSTFNTAIASMITGSLTSGQLVIASGTNTVTSGTALPNGTTATTQTSSDSSTKVATTAFVHSVASASATYTYDILTATSDGQTSFASTPLSHTPNTNYQIQVVLRQGTFVDQANDFTISGTTLTWTNTNVSLVNGDVLYVQYSY